MRTAVTLLALVTVAGTGFAQRPPYKSAEGKYSIKFPDSPKVTEKTTKSAAGELTVVIATFAVSDGSIYMVSYTDYPNNIEEKDRAAILDAVRDGVKGKDGKVSDEKTTTLGEDKWPVREFTVAKDRDRQRIKSRVVLRDNRMYHVSVIGTATFVDSRNAKEFLESLELTK